MHAGRQHLHHAGGHQRLQFRLHQALDLSPPLSRENATAQSPSRLLPSTILARPQPGTISSIGAKDRLTVRYFQDNFRLDGVLNLTDLLTYADEANINYYNSLISETHTFNGHILNNFILSYQIENDSRGPLPGSISVADLGVNIWQPRVQADQFDRGDGLLQHWRRIRRAFSAEPITR